MNTQRVHVAVVASYGAEKEMFWHAKLLASCKNARLHHIFAPAFAVAEDDATSVAEARQLAASQKLDLIASEWLDDTRAIQDLLHLAQERDLAAVFVRTGMTQKVGRIVVATGGGPNSYEQMWLAREVAGGNEVPVAVLHWAGAANESSEDEVAENERLEKMCLRLLGMKVEFLQCSGDDFTEAVAGILRPDDLLVIGAPSPLRLVADFAGSLPDQLAKRIPNPLILLSSPPLGKVSLRRLLWNKLAKPRLRARNKEEALEILVDNLITHNQLPVSSKADILARALEREQVSSTAVDCETAFPHIELPGFFGVAGTLGIFPEGIDFDSDDGSKTNFVYLLVTPEGFCDEHLAVLSKISKRMLDSAVRAALLESETADEVLDILDPRQPGFRDLRAISGSSSSCPAPIRSRRMDTGTEGDVAMEREPRWSIRAC